MCLVVLFTGWLLSYHFLLLTLCHVVASNDFKSVTIACTKPILVPSVHSVIQSRYNYAGKGQQATDLVVEKELTEDNKPSREKQAGNCGIATNSQYSAHHLIVVDCKSP
jgi:hypothetical protein